MPGSKKQSPDASANAYLKTGNQSDQQNNLINLLHRRASEDK